MFKASEGNASDLENRTFTRGLSSLRRERTLSNSGSARLGKLEHTRNPTKNMNPGMLENQIKLKKKQFGCPGEERGFRDPDTLGSWGVLRTWGEEQEESARGPRDGGRADVAFHGTAVPAGSSPGPHECAAAPSQRLASVFLS